MITPRASDVARLARVVLLAVGEAASVGLAIWALASHDFLVAYARDNDLESDRRPYVLLNVAVAVGVGLAVVAGLLVWKRGGLDFVERFVRRNAPLALVGALPLLFEWHIWQGRETVFFASVLAFGFGLRAALDVAWSTDPVIGRPTPWTERAVEWVRALRARVDGATRRVDVPLLVVVLCACAYAGYFSGVTIVHHRNIMSSSFDLGLEDNLMWNLLHGRFFRATPFSGPEGTHFGHHATFFSYVLAPVYAVAPHPETLLVVQALFMGGAAVPLFLYARRHLSPWVAALVACLYLAYPPLHGANLYEFHYLPLGVFFLWLVLYAIETRRRALAVVAAILTLSMREDVSAMLAVLGLILLLTGKAVRAGAALAVAGAGYFLLMKLAVMPHFESGGDESFLNQYSGMIPHGEKGGFGSVLSTVAGNPAYVANLVLDKDKVGYLLALFTPLLLLPLRRPIAALLVVPGFFFTLLSTGYRPLYEISFQYTSYWTAFLFIGLVVSLEHIGPARIRPWLVGLAAASIVCTSYDGAFLQHDTVRGGFDPFRFGTTDSDRHRREELATLVARIPEGASVAASERLVPHVSGRSDAYTLRFGAYDAECLLFELPTRGDERPVVTPLLVEGTYGVTDDLGDMVLARRGAPASANAAVLARIH
jgi:uncharacterized membrane protein